MVKYINFLPVNRYLYVRYRQLTMSHQATRLLNASIFYVDLSKVMSDIRRLINRLSMDGQS